MWTLNTPWYDSAIRGVFIFLFLFFLVRLIGKKQLNKYSPFELILLIIVSEAIYTEIIGNDHSIPAVVISTSVLFGLYMLLNELTYRFAWFERLIEGQPKVIILNGKIHKRVMKREKISEADLFEAIREHEIMKSEDVKCAILEKDGKISVIKYNH